MIKKTGGSRRELRESYASLYSSAINSGPKGPFNPKKPSTHFKSLKWPEFAFKHRLFRRLLGISNLWTSNQKPQNGSNQGLNHPGRKGASQTDSRSLNPYSSPFPWIKRKRTLESKGKPSRVHSSSLPRFVFGQKTRVLGGLKFYLRVA